MEQIDLTGVDPERRAETLRRVELVKRYIGLDRPSKQDAEEMAAQIGIGRNQFLLLVRAWREHGRASALPATKRRFQQPATQRYKLTPEIEQVIAEAIEDVGVDGTKSSIKRAVDDRCRAVGLTPPSANAVASRLRAAQKRAWAGSPRAGAILIGRCATDVPVLDPSGQLAPAVLALAVSGGDGRILAFDAGVAGSPGSIAKVIDILAQAPSREPQVQELLITLPQGPERRRFEGAFKVAGLMGHVRWVGAYVEPAATVQGALAGRLGPLALTLVRNKENWKFPLQLRAQAAAPIARSSLPRQIQDLVDAHNADPARASNADRPHSLGDAFTVEILRRAIANLRA